MKPVGWGNTSPSLQQQKKVIALSREDMPHKIFWDHKKTRLQLETSGYQANFDDKKFGISFDDLEHLSVRQQKAIIQERAQKLNRDTRLKFKFRNSPNKYRAGTVFAISPKTQNIDAMEMKHLGAFSP